MHTPLSSAHAPAPHILRQLADAVIFDVAAGDDANVKDLMALKDDVAFPGKEAFGDAAGVQ